MARTSLSTLLWASALRSVNSYKLTLWASRPALSRALKPLSHWSENLKRCRAAARSAAPHMCPDGCRIVDGVSAIRYPRRSRRETRGRKIVLRHRKFKQAGGLTFPAVVFLIGAIAFFNFAVKLQHFKVREKPPASRAH